MKKNSIDDFLKNDYVNQASSDTITSLSKIDGFKFTSAKAFHVIRKITEWTKVENVANRTADVTNYIAGSNNISGVITNMGRDYIGSNNLPTISAKGSFGNRLNNSAAAPRYIFTKQSNIMKYVFRKEDDAILPTQIFEGDEIEPRYFLPIIPMILVNGSKAIGNGYSQTIYPRNVKSIIQYLKKRIKTNVVEFDVCPSWDGFKGTVQKDNEKENKYLIDCDFIRVNTTTIQIDEVPISFSYNKYINKLNELEDKGIIKTYIDKCDPKKDVFNIEVKCSREFIKQNDETIKHILGLTTTITENFTIINNELKIIDFQNVQDVIDYYYQIRYTSYEKRKKYQLNQMKYDLEVLSNKIRFIKSINEGKIVLKGKSKNELTEELFDLLYIKCDNSYDYLLNMSLHSLTKYKEDELQKKHDILKNEIAIYQNTDIKDIWLKEIEELELALGFRKRASKKKIIVEDDEPLF